MYYLGSAFSENTAQIFLEKLQVANPYGNLISLPRDCEIAVRSNGSESYLFVLNYSKEEQKLTLHKQMNDLYRGEMVSGELTLEGYGTRVFKIEEQ